MTKQLIELNKRIETLTIDDLFNFVEEIKQISFDTNEELNGLIALAGAATSTVFAKHFGQTLGRNQSMNIVMTYINSFVMCDCPIKLLMYDEMLFPAYEARFDKVIPVHVFEYLQTRANFILSSEEVKSKLNEDIISHLESISIGHVPFGYKVVS